MRAETLPCIAGALLLTSCANPGPVRDVSVKAEPTSVGGKLMIDITAETCISLKAIAKRTGNVITVRGRGHVTHEDGNCGSNPIEDHGLLRERHGRRTGRFVRARRAWPTHVV